MWASEGRLLSHIVCPLVKRTVRFFSLLFARVVHTKEDRLALNVSDYACSGKDAKRLVINDTFFSVYIVSRS